MLSICLPKGCRIVFGPAVFEVMIELIWGEWECDYIVIT